MKLKKNYTGADYATMRYAVYTNAREREYGDEPVGPTYFPTLTNGEVVAFAQAWKRAAARSSTPRWPAWYEMVIAALGWSAPGDRFNMSEDHAKRAAPAELIEQLWIASDELAVQLDTAHTVVKPLIVDYSRDGYNAAAREAWHVMKTEATMLPVDIDAAQPITSPSQVDDTVSPTAGSSGLGMLLLLAILAWAMKK